MTKGRVVVVLVSVALGLAAAARASTRIPEPLHLALRRASLIVMIRVEAARPGQARSERVSPCDPADRAGVDSVDTVTGTFSRVLKSDLGRWPVRAGQSLSFLRRRSEPLPWLGGRPLRAGDSLLIRFDGNAWPGPEPQLLPLEDPARLPVWQTVLAHEEEWPGKLEDLLRDAGRFDEDISPSAFHELSRMGARAAPAHAELLTLIPKAAAAGRLYDVGIALWSSGLSPDSLRAAMESVLDRFGASRQKDAIRLLAMAGPGSLPRLSRYALSDPDEWVRQSALRTLCDPEVRGPSAEAIVRRAIAEEKIHFVHHGARKLLHECYGGPPAD